MLAVFVAVLALAGAPTDTPIVCLASIQGGVYGQVAWTADGPQHIELQNRICLAVRFVAANRQERNQIAAERPSVFMAQVVGVGLLVALHEAEHVALVSFDECKVEKAALRKVPVLLKRFMPLLWQSALAFARDYDRGLPASYHGC